MNITAETLSSDDVSISQSILLDDGSWTFLFEPSFWEKLDVPVNERLDT